MWQMFARVAAFGVRHARDDSGVFRDHLFLVSVSVNRFEHVFTVPGVFCCGGVMCVCASVAPYRGAPNVIASAAN